MKIKTVVEKTAELPDTLSGLLRIALDDLQKCEKSKLYEIDMGAWHEPSENKPTCRVCLAGSVIAQRFDVPPTSRINDDDWTPEENNKFNALDNLRMGRVGVAIDSLAGNHWSITRHELDTDVTDYDDDRKQFKKDMKKLLADLETAGL